MLYEIEEAIRKGYSVKFRRVPAHVISHDYNIRIEVICDDHHEARDISPICIGDSTRGFEDLVCWTLDDLIRRMDTRLMIYEILQ